MIWPGDQGISGNDPRTWDPATETITNAYPQPGSLALPGYDLFCTGHSFLADGRLFVAGGHITNPVGLPNASIYDPFQNVWTRLPDMIAGRWYPALQCCRTATFWWSQARLTLSPALTKRPRCSSSRPGQPGHGITSRSSTWTFTRICSSRQTARSSIREQRTTSVILIPGAVCGVPP